MYRREQPDKSSSKKQVTHFLEKGQFCDEIKDHRQARVVLQCSTKLVGGQLTIQLNEPSMCVYTLVMESPLFCEVASFVDEDGVLVL